MPLFPLRKFGGKRLGRLVRDRSGAIMVTAAVMLTVIIGVTGLGTDVGVWYLMQRKVQNAADSAAVAGGFELIELPQDHAAVVAAAVDDARFNGFDNDNGAVVTPVVGEDGLSVRITVETPAPLFFSKLFLDTPPDVRGRATAEVTLPLCLLALDPAGSGALQLTGNADVSAEKCLVQVNSTSATAAMVGGTASLTAGRTCIVGQATGSGYAPPPETFCEPLADPLAGLAPPPVGACTHTNASYGSGTWVLTRGVYCGGLVADAMAHLVLQPGVYVIKDGPLVLAAGAVVEGAGVGFYLTGPDAVVVMDGGAEVDLAAATSGPLKGVVFYQGPDAPAGVTSTLTGTSDARYYGSLYFPTQTVEFTGDSATVAVPPAYTMVVAHRFIFSGNGELAFRAEVEGGNVPLPTGMTPPRPVLTE